MITSIKNAWAAFLQSDACEHRLIPDLVCPKPDDARAVKELVYRLQRYDGDNWTTIATFPKDMSEDDMVLILEHMIAQEVDLAAMTAEYLSREVDAHFAGDSETQTKGDDDGKGLAP